LRKSAYVLISYNNEGIIDDATWSDLLEPYVTELFEIKYNAYRGSRNLAGRSNKVMERMYLVSQWLKIVYTAEYSKWDILFILW
jgi:adenine-specific DNA methylase